MTILTFKRLSISVDQVLRAQGMNPESVHRKNQKIIDLTEQAIQIGYKYLEPKAIFESYRITSVLHNQINFENGRNIKGELIGNVLPKSEKVILAVCTVGKKISEFAISLFSTKPAMAMAVEGMAVAATEILGNQICQLIDSLAELEGLSTSIPINPGMIGWPVEEGQPQIFSCIDTSPIEVTLLPSNLMQPLKTLSMAIGVGKDINNLGITCDYCNLQKTCTFRSYHSQ